MRLRRLGIRDGDWEGWGVMVELAVEPGMN
jgi:hypothetical protein